MSRCFPFPPPGYEKKPGTDDVDLLKKERHREKKHKKEKNDKEKKDDKDRKEKDKSEGKHRDKKDRKEKSKEKRKDKEREKGRYKTGTSQEKIIPAQVESCNGDPNKFNHKAGERNITSNEKQGTLFRGHIGEKPVEKSLFNEGVMDKFVLDLCSRIKEEAKGSASQSTERSPFAGRTNHDRTVKNETGIMPVEKEKKVDKTVDIRKMGRQGVSVGGTSSIKNETGIMHAEKEKKVYKRDDNRKMGRQEVGVGATVSDSPVVQNIGGKEKNENKAVNIGGEFQSRAEEIPRILEKSNEQRDKNPKKDSEDKQGSKRKDKNKEKKSHGKDKEREKDKNKKETTKEKSERGIKDHDKANDSINNGHAVSQNLKLALVPDGNRNPFVGQNTKLPGLVMNGDRNPILGQSIQLPPFIPDSNRIAAVEGNLKKRKEIEANGFLHETNIVPNKKLRPTPHPSIENEKILETCQTPVLRTPDRKVPPPNNVIKVNNNDLKVYGKIELQPLSISLKKPSSSSSSSSSSSRNKAVQAPIVKPPHPDAKYLSEVLSVPKIEEWCGIDDEEWLFSSNGRVSAGPIETSETPRTGNLFGVLRTSSRVNLLCFRGRSKLSHRFSERMAKEHHKFLRHKLGNC